ncbi:WD repeat-containing protein 5 homolog [Periplaneta americana]|uniref:WD repeat-containing protein 5 homolog n=1 Tax=Periplaneta americana TaxID=6978 RepID=UPI0037E8F71E
MEQAFPIMCIRYHPVKTEVFYAASADGAVYICNAENGDFSRYIQEEDNEINTVDISVNAALIATGGKDGAVRLYDTDTAEILMIYQKALKDTSTDALKFHRMRIFALRFHPTMTETFVTGGWDDMVKIWDIRVKNGCIRNIRGPHICGDAIDLKENVVLTGSWIVAGSLQLWDIGSAKLIETVKPSNRPTTLDGEFLYAVQYFDGDPYGEMVCAGGSGTGAVEVISLKENRVLGNFRVNKATQTIDSHGNVLAFGGVDPVLRMGEFA